MPGGMRRTGGSSFGTGKLGDLAGFSSAIILAMIALLIGYEAVTRLLHPIAISFNQAIPIAMVGLMVNVASALILGGGHEHEDHDHGHQLSYGDHDHKSAHRDNNMRAAFVHVLADAVVSVLAIAGLAAGKFFGWVFMDPAMGIIGAAVIANWSFGLIRDTGAVLLDMSPDRRMAEKVRGAIEADGDTLADLHLWRLGPGHLAAILSVVTGKPRSPEFYRARLQPFHGLSHVTIEVHAR